MTSSMSHGNRWRSVSSKLSLSTRFVCEWTSFSTNFWSNLFLLWEWTHPSSIDTSLSFTHRLCDRSWLVRHPAKLFFTLEQKVTNKLVLETEEEKDDPEKAVEELKRQMRNKYSTMYGRGKDSARLQRPPPSFTPEVRAPCPAFSNTTSKSLSPSSCWVHTPILYDVWLLSFVVQDRIISCTDRVVNKTKSLFQSFRAFVRTDFLDTTINNCQTDQETQSTMTRWEFISIWPVSGVQVSVGHFTS